ncbi:hypothetical protein AB0D38_34790 [Streptomyces sp. NPDC048279]|uniref:hypothetical protein n=1 Tax=Streptomyces sp. NPDC048279 TaxID=3154714 RepID=UPI00341B1CE8
MYVYVITAPTGTIRRLIVDDLLGRGEKPCLVTRDASRLAPGVGSGPRSSRARTGTRP